MSDALSPTVKTAAVAVTALALARALFYIRSTVQLESVKATGARKRSDLAYQWKDVDAGLGAGDPEEVDNICSRTAEDLTAAMQSGELSVENVVRAFCIRAREVHRECNCLTEIMILEALEEATRMDTRGEGKDLPLYGLPISLKDQIHVTGQDSTMGLHGLIGQPALEDSPIVTILRRQGAIPFCKTNIPQTLLSFECSNPLFGRTRHPHNPDVTPGGSSGGEGCLLARNGSAFGIGSDIGGSVRIPAHMSGIYCLKPSGGRLPVRGNQSSLPGQEAIVGVLGPMGRSVGDVHLVTRAIVEGKPWEMDPSCIELPWRPHLAASGTKMRFGYYAQDGFFKASPACARGVQVAVDALRAAGHEVVEFVPPRVEEAMLMYYALVGAGSGAVVKRLRGEPIEPMMKPVVFSFKLPPLARGLLVLLLRLGGQPRASRFLKTSRSCDIPTYYDWIYKRNQYRTEFLYAWRASGIDALICPAHAFPAVPHGSFPAMTHAACYTMLYNILDLPVGTQPVTKVDPQLDALPAGYAPRDLMHRTSYHFYSAEKMEGLPIGVQVVGLRLQEEVVLKGMQELETALAAADAGASRSG